MTVFRIDGAGDLAEALRIAAAEAGWREGGDGDGATFILPPAGGSFAAIVEQVDRVRSSRPQAIVVLLDSLIPDLNRAAFIGALGQLAIGAAPTVRIAADEVANGADRADAAAAALFLAGAESTTGQLLTVAPVTA